MTATTAGVGAVTATETKARPERVRAVRSSWREATLTRVMELEALSAWIRDWIRELPEPEPGAQHILDGLVAHLEQARTVASCDTRHRLRHLDGALLQKAISHLDGAEANLLRVAPPGYVLGQMPGLLNHVQRHLPVGDLRRREFERIAADVGLAPIEVMRTAPSPRADHEQLLKRIGTERDRIVSIVRGASSAAMREQLQVRSFKNVVVAATAVMFALVLALAVFGWVKPAALPLCFQPEQSGQTVVVCPTGESSAVAVEPNQARQPNVDERVGHTVRPPDIAVVEGVGLVAAAVAAAAAIRRMRGSSEPHGLPVALAMLKLRPAP